MPTTDNFNRADGGLGANWATASGDGAPDIASNECRFAADPCAAYYSAAAPSSANHYAQCVLRTMIGSGDGTGPMVRCSSVLDTKYFLSANTANTQMYRVVAGVYTQLGSNGSAAATGNTAYLEANGTSLTSKINGSTVVGPITDAAIGGTGFAGVFGSNGASNPTVDDFEFDALAAGGGTSILRQMMNYHGG